MDDIQSLEESRGIALDCVGVRDLRYPIVVLDQANGRQETIARISLSVGLPHDVRETHMSRFVEVLNVHRGELTARTLPNMLVDLRSRLFAESAAAEIEFTYFLARSAPVSGSQGLLDYDCSFRARSSPASDEFILSVKVPVTSLCPCSKAISDYGAHNQRGYVTVSVKCRNAADIVWIEDLIELVESHGSSPIYPLLKRTDERHVTMQAYDKPAFVEDIARDVAAALRADARLSWYSVEVVNMESIHNHSAFAKVEEMIEADRPVTVEVAPVC